MFRCDEGCSVPEFAVRRRDLFAELRERVGGTSRTRLLWSSPEAGFFSARVISAVFGFPDNLGVHVRCNGTQSQVNVAAELIGALSVPAAAWTAFTRGPSPPPSPRSLQWDTTTSVRTQPT